MGGNHYHIVQGMVSFQESDAVNFFSCTVCYTDLFYWYNEKRSRLCSHDVLFYTNGRAVRTFRFDFILAKEILNFRDNGHLYLLPVINEVNMNQGLLHLVKMDT